jgi:anti-anti-sigma regulatory factor
MKYSETETYTILDCEQYLEFNAINSLKEIFAAVLILKKPVIIKASEISQIDTACLQLFLAFILALRKEYLSWQWENISSYMMNLIILVGMKQLFEIN